MTPKLKAREELTGLSRPRASFNHTSAFENRHIGGERLTPHANERLISERPWQR
jgi:hypothetical protein